MLNWLWGFMIIIGIVYALITGNIESVTQGAFVSAKEAVTLCITMFGIMSFWCGLMEIAEKSGLIDKCRYMIEPLIKWLFPGVPIAYRSQYKSPDPTAILFPSIIATTISTLAAVIFCRVMTRRER